MYRVSCFSLLALACSSVALGQVIPGPTSAVLFESESADIFSNQITSKVLHTNYVLQNYSYQFTNSDELPMVLEKIKTLRKFVADRVYQLCAGQNREPSHCENGSNLIRGSYVEKLDSDVSGREFAMWMYKLDGDNWFEFDDAFRETQKYLATGNREFRIFRGFNPDGVLADGLVQKDLPMVVDFDEKTMTFWTIKLED